MCGLGLIGTGSTGKTTLAKAVSSATGIPYVATQVRAAYAACGILPETKVTHAQKMEAQHLILNMAEADYLNVCGLFITDRTPMDFAAYVLAEATATNLSDEETEEVLEYVRRCYSMTNLYFSSLVLLQPVFKPVPEVGRPTNGAFLEHINMIMTGLIADPDHKLFAAKHFLKKSIIDLSKRVDVVIKIAALVENKNMNDGKLAANH